jgi:hypothetical protein
MNEQRIPAAHRREWVSDAWRIAVILAFTLVTRCWMVKHTEVASRDSIAFIRYALQIEDPPPAGTFWWSLEGGRIGVLKANFHPPGYPVALLAVSYPVRAVMGGTSCDAMVMSAQITNVLAALLLTFPMYFLGKLVFRRQTAFIATLLFQVLPVCTMVTSDGLSDGLFLLTSMVSLWFAALGFRRQSAGWFAAAGAVAGVSYLVRPEGLVVALGVGCILVACKFRAGWNWRLTLSRGALYGAALATVMAPYVMTIGRLTNKPTGNDVIDTFKGQNHGPSWVAPEQSQAPSGVDFPLAAWWRTADGNRALWAGKALFSEVSKTAYYILPFFAAIGLLVMRRRIGADPAAALIFVVICGQLLLLWLIAAAAGYVSERHTLFPVMLGSYFTAAAFPVVGRFITKSTKYGKQGTWAAAIAAGCILACVPAGMKPLHANRAGHHAAGKWIAQHRHDDDFVLDPFGWAEFYAGHVRLPDTFWRPIGGAYVIVEKGIDDHPRLHLMPWAKQYIEKGKTVYHWPENKPIEEAKVRVYYVLSPGHEDDGHNRDKRIAATSSSQ